MSGNHNHPTLFQEAGFFAFEFSWLHSAIEHHWANWIPFLILVVGIFYSRYGTLWATNCYNKKIVQINNEFYRWASITTIVIAVIVIPWLALKLFELLI